MNLTLYNLVKLTKSTLTGHFDDIAIQRIQIYEVLRAFTNLGKRRLHYTSTVVAFSGPIQQPLPFKKNRSIYRGIPFELFFEKRRICSIACDKVIVRGKLSTALVTRPRKPANLVTRPDGIEGFDRTDPPDNVFVVMVKGAETWVGMQALDSP